MDFYEVVNSRRTIRDFENVSMDDKIIEKIISAGMKAPTNDHMRDWHFIVIKDKGVVLKLIDKIPVEISDEEINNILMEWNLKDNCQQNAYKNAIPKQYRMLAEAPQCYGTRQGKRLKNTPKVSYQSPAVLS